MRLFWVNFKHYDKDKKSGIFLVVIWVCLVSLILDLRAQKGNFPRGTFSIFRVRCLQCIWVGKNCPICSRQKEWFQTLLKPSAILCVTHQKKNESKCILHAKSVTSPHTFAFIEGWTDIKLQTKVEIKLILFISLIYVIWCLINQ